MMDVRLARLPNPSESADSAGDYLGNALAFTHWQTGHKTRPRAEEQSKGVIEMKRHLALLALIIFAVSGLAIAQNPNPVLGQGYYGQQAPAPAVAGSQTAQLHSHTAAATPIMIVRCCDVKKVQKDNNVSAPTAREGDPTASQNQIEYRGA